MICSSYGGGMENQSNKDLTPIKMNYQKQAEKKVQIGRRIQYVMKINMNINEPFSTIIFTNQPKVVNIYSTLDKRGVAYAVYIMLLLFTIYST